MITLDFRIDEHEFSNDLASDPNGTDAGVLEETYFVCPVRFSIDGIELLALPAQDDPWRDLPLLGMAWGVRQMIALPPGGGLRLHLAGGGHLDLQSEDKSVRVINSLSGAKGRASTSELKHMATQFLWQLRETFEVRAPQLTNHPGWSAWFG